MSKHLLSKSSFVKGCQCIKALYLNKHHPELKDEISFNQQAVFDKGHTIGLLAQKLFPNGIDLNKKNGFDYEKSIEELKTILKNQNAVTYEAPFLYDEVLAILDIFVCKDGKNVVYEVKSSTKVSETYILDSALQYWVITNSGTRLDDFFIVHINNKYLKNGDLDINEFFKIESVIDRILPLQASITNKVQEFKTLLKITEIPQVEIGEQCNAPYHCEFYGHCWKHIPEFSVFDIYRLSNKKKFELYRNGVVKFDDIPSDFKLTSIQKKQVYNTLNGTTSINRDGVNDFVQGLNYPLYFLDFETINPAVPLFNNSRPFQMIVFQYSLHKLESKGSDLEHFEFLAEANLDIDPRIPFIEQLIVELKDIGDILVYNIAFERSRLKEIAKLFPQYADSIEEIIKRMKDLLVPFQKGYYYSPEMKGSFSIKNVLPALLPELSYKDLEISNGGMASSKFEELYFETDVEKIRSVRNNLLKYCSLDTFAMVKILEVLEAL